MSDEQMVPLMVPESVVREFADGACYSAADYRRFADTARWPRRLDYLARAAAIEWVKAHPEPEWVTRDTTLGTEIASVDWGDVRRWLVGWDRADNLLAETEGQNIGRWDPDGWYVVRGASAPGDLEGGRR